MHRYLIPAAVAGLLFAAFFATKPALHPTALARPADRVPRFDGLGRHTRPVCENKEAQAYFDQGLAFLFAFNHDEAIRAFEQAAGLDPECPMAHWGVATANGMHINKTAVEPARARAAHEAMKRAERHVLKAKEADLPLIAAAAVRFADPAPADPRKFDEAYAKAMKAAWEKHPTDGDIGALYAESLMNLRPWDLWTADGKPQPETPEVVATLEAVMKLNPAHPLACHLYIHAVEASPHPEKADAAADRLRDLQPALGHMVHMPSHIDVRRGRWQHAVEANEKAIRADDAYRAVSEKQGFYRLYMAHNHHMLAFAAMMQGESKKALAAVRTMIAGVPKEWVAVKENAAIADGFLAAPLEVMMRFGMWDEILEEPEAAELFPIARALRHHARGVALAAKGEPKKAREELASFRAAAKATPKEATFGNNTAADLYAVADPMLEGEILAREGKVKDAIEHLGKAVAAEDKLRYAEPPDWFVPVRHALGAFLLKDRQLADAEKVYREDLRRWADNGWSLHGLGTALEAQGKKAEAQEARERFAKVFQRADVTIPASCFCATD
jgi:tetratricopeptide (TPR) repeat protein